jgi:monoterpene epsilon-lactone hydrolase
MKPTDLPLPPSISKQAQEFIANAPPQMALPLDEDAIKAARQYNQDTYLDDALAYAKSLGGNWKDVSIAGHPVLEVTPKDYSSDKSGKAMLYFYGGGHIVGSPEEDLPIMVPLANQLGSKIYAHRYPLAPESPFPAAVNAATEVYGWLSKKYGSHNLVVTGESAGANLALGTLLKARDEQLGMPAALALLSPWADIAGNGDSHNVDIDPTLSMDSIGNTAARAYVNDDSSLLANPYCSPIHGEYDSSFPATLITTGTRDFLLSDCARLSTRMRLSGVDVSLHLWEGLWHVFEFYPQIPEAGQSLREIANFLDGHLSTKSD